MTAFFCTRCWSGVPETATICPHCGDNIAARQARTDYADKLIAALRHPEPTTPIRAAWILGERRERKAIEPLVRLAHESADPFVVESAVEALGKMEDRQVLETLRWAAEHPSLRVRRQAQRALQQFADAAAAKHEFGRR